VIGLRYDQGNTLDARGGLITMTARRSVGNLLPGPEGVRRKLKKYRRQGMGIRSTGTKWKGSKFLQGGKKCFFLYNFRLQTTEKKRLVARKCLI